MSVKKLGFLFLLLTTFNFNLFAHGCTGNACVEIETDQEILNSGKVSYEFYLIDEKISKVLTEDDLEIQHEKKLHMFVYDEALKEFQHVHPTFNGTFFTVDLEFKKNGNYTVFAQGLLTSGEEFAAPTKLKVTGGEAANDIINLGEVLKGEDGNTVIEFKAKNLVAGKMAMPILVFSRKDGSAPELTDWLGAKAHVVATQFGSETLLHVHPMDTGKPNELMLHTTFPKIGEYRLWIQFIDANVLKTIPLSVVVKK